MTFLAFRVRWKKCSALAPAILFGQIAANLDASLGHGRRSVKLASEKPGAAGKKILARSHGPGIN
jgi:hypothetical protein